MCDQCRQSGQLEGFSLRDDGKTIDVVSDVEDFHLRFAIPGHSEPKGLRGDVAKFRSNRLQEEVDEYNKALEEEDAAGQLDALVDLVYIAVGTAFISGFRFSEAFARVHAANMLKVRAQRPEDSRHGTTLDIVKPEGWTAPDLSDLCQGLWEVHLSDGSKVELQATGKQDAFVKCANLLETDRNVPEDVQVEEVLQL